LLKDDFGETKTLQLSILHRFNELHPRKVTNDNGKTTMDEDVSPTKNGDVPASHVSFQGSISDERLFPIFSFCSSFPHLAVLFATARARINDAPGGVRSSHDVCCQLILLVAEILTTSCGW